MSFPTRNVALGLIARRSSYGYAVLQQLRRWAIRPAAVRTSSVYTALSRLTADGLVEARPSAASTTSGRPSRIFFRITPRGQEHLESWLRTPPLSHEELRLRVALARPQDIDHLLGFLAAAERSCLARLREHDVAPTLHELLDRDPPWEHLCSTLLGTLDVCALNGRAQWLRDARVALDRAAREAGFPVARRRAQLLDEARGQTTSSHSSIVMRSRERITATRPSLPEARQSGRPHRD